jgi:hypothetical protein
MIKSVLLAGAASATLMLAATAALAASHTVAPKAVAPKTVAPKAAAAWSSPSDVFAGLSVGGDWLGGGSVSNGTSGLTVEGTASGEYQLMPSLGVQGDVVYRNQKWQNANPTLNSASHDFEFALHGFTRSEQYLLGAFVQYGEGYLGYLDGLVGVDVSHVFGGAEAQLFLGDATLYGQAGVKHYSFGSAADARGYFGTFEARYYLQPDFKIDAHVGYETLDGFVVGNGSESTLNLGAGAEYHLADTPYSFFGKYDYSLNGVDTADPAWSHRVLVGVKFNFDGPTLEQRDRSGASLKPFESHDYDFSGLFSGF